MKICVDESLPLIKNLFNKEQFNISYFNKNTKQMSCDTDIVLCRAHSQINKIFLNGFKPKLIASATSGSDHIDKDFLEQNKISYIDAIGSNATSVCDYILHLLHHPKLHLNGKKIGIIGIGHVGSKVNIALSALGFETVLYDPPRAAKENTFKSHALKKLYECDVITLHVPLEKNGKYKTANLINNNFLSKLRAKSVIINTSRGEVLCEDAILNNMHLIYCLDVFKNEPYINTEVIRQCKFATPHIAGHAIEAKKRAVVMLFKKIVAFFEMPAQTTSYDHLLKLEQANQNYNFIYDPMLETKKLKLKPNAETFLTLRKSHTTRHEL